MMSYLNIEFLKIKTARHGPEKERRDARETRLTRAAGRTACGGDITVAPGACLLIRQSVRRSGAPGSGFVCIIQETKRRAGKEPRSG